MCFTIGIYTYAPLSRNSVENYPHKDELQLIFPDKSNGEIQQLINEDMNDFIKLTNIFRTGDILNVDPHDLDYHFLNNDDENLENNRVQVVDTQIGIAIFKKPFESVNYLSNIDQTMSLKEYSNQDLSLICRNDKSFSIGSHVRSVLKVFIEDIKTGVRYSFNYNNNDFKLVRRVKIGDIMNIDDKELSIKEIIPNYLMIENEEHWNYVRLNQGEYRDQVSNSYRCNFKTTDDNIIELHNKTHEITHRVKCECIDRVNTYRNICNCQNDSNHLENEHLIDLFR